MVEKEECSMISYDRLWKTLIDKHMKKTELRDVIGISNATLAKMGKNEPVNLKIIESICKELECGIEDVVEIIL
jgi:DNA-binding Xre family transcriptional regulator